MPNGVMLFNLKKNEITFENETLKKVFEGYAESPDNASDKSKSVAAVSEEESAIGAKKAKGFYKSMVRMELTDEEKKQLKTRKMEEKKKDNKSLKSKLS